MNFIDFINAVSESGTTGKIFAIILCLISLAWIFEVFMLPFYISRIDTKVQTIEKYMKSKREEQHGI